eukprot:scaffold47625_cov81-Attheya_sp.AAC.1
MTRSIRSQQSTQFVPVGTHTIDVLGYLVAYDIIASHRIASRPPLSRLQHSHGRSSFRERGARGGICEERDFLLRKKWLCTYLLM